MKICVLFVFVVFAFVIVKFLNHPVFFLSENSIPPGEGNF